MAAPSQDRNDGHDLPAHRRNRQMAQLAPWLYLGVLLGSGWLLFLHPQTRVLQPEQASTSWLLAWIFGGIVVGAVVWSLRLARPGLAPPSASYPLSARLPDSWGDAYAALLRPTTADPIAAAKPDPAGTQRGAAWHRFGGGMLSVETFDPNDATRAPWDGLDAQSCIMRLDDVRQAWHNAAANRTLQQERRYWLDVVLSLVDHGVMRPLQDGYLPDTAALRTERFLLGADAGPIVLSEVPALFARRLALAIEAMPTAQREAASVQWRLLQQLHALVAEGRMLDERSQVIQVLAWDRMWTWTRSKWPTSWPPNTAKACPTGYAAPHWCACPTARCVWTKCCYRRAARSVHRPMTWTTWKRCARCIAVSCSCSVSA